MLQLLTKKGNKCGIFLIKQCTSVITPVNYKGGNNEVPQYQAGTMKSPSHSQLLWSCDSQHSAATVVALETAVHKSVLHILHIHTCVHNYTNMHR